MVWIPHVTVAAVVERDGRFLLVEEETDDGIRFNQPAGHLECGESLSEAVVRETLEETGWEVAPTALVGIYQWKSPRDGRHFLRVALAAEPVQHHAGRRLDEGIVRALWLAPAELQALAPRHRSPLVWRCVADHLGGSRHPLDLVRQLA